MQTTPRGDSDARLSYGPSTVKRHRRSRAEIEALDAAIITAVNAEHPVSLRGVYYRVVSAGAVEKTENGYRAVGRRLLALRRNGRIPYTHITDGTRWVTKPDSWSSVEACLADIARVYRRALWERQPVDVHVFVEKDAISGVILPITESWDVPLGVQRGHVSETFAYSVAAAIEASGKPAVFYQLGDHDPAGVDAWRDFAKKVSGFAPGADITFERLAVTPEQIAEWSLPTRSTKQTDSRAKSFKGASVEVDAIPANVLRQLVEDAIRRHGDDHELHVLEVAQASERAYLQAIARAS